MSDSLLAATLHLAATLIGDQLPASFSMVPGPMVLDGDAAAHAMPHDGLAVRWPLGADEGVLVIAVPGESAAMLRGGPSEVSLIDALTSRLAPTLDALAPLFGGVTPTLGTPMEVEVDLALDGGPGDAVSVALDDDGAHRGTIAVRLVVTDEMLLPSGVAQGTPATTSGHAVDAPLEADMRQDGDEDVSLDMDIEQTGDDDMGVNDGAIPGVRADNPPALQPAPPVVAAAPASRAPYRDPIGPPQGEAHPADFASFDQLSALPGTAHPLTMLGDVEMGVTAELGRTRLSVREVLGLNQGSIIELDRAAGSPVDVVVNGTLIARGEVVVIDEEFGIRITEIVGMDADADAGAAMPLPLAQ